PVSGGSAILREDRVPDLRGSCRQASPAAVAPRGECAAARAGSGVAAHGTCCEGERVLVVEPASYAPASGTTHTGSPAASRRGVGCDGAVRQPQRTAVVD